MNEEVQLCDACGEQINIFFQGVRLRPYQVEKLVELGYEHMLCFTCSLIIASNIRTYSLLLKIIHRTYGRIVKTPMLFKGVELKFDDE